MLRRWLLLVPAVAAVAAALAALVQPVPAAAIGVVLGLGVTALLSTVAERHVQRLEGRLADVSVRSQRRYDELSRERANVQRLLDSLPTAILLFEPDRLGYANPAAMELFGVRRSERRSPLQVLGVEGLADAVTEARESGRGIDIEVDRDGRQLTAHAAVSGDEVVALVVMDVTDARRLEAIRRDFVTNASHELKTPAAGMQALADSLALAIDRHPERARSMIGRLQSEAARLAKLVGELLDLARLEEDAAVPEGRQRVDLAHIVKLEVERLQQVARERHVTVNLGGNGPAPLVAFPGDIQLIAANLLENAIRYNRPGGRVDVRAHRDAARVVLEVADNGIGIAEADRDRVFERFYRVDKAARSQAGGGTGLGLSIVRHAVERHGGDVSVRSVLGEGSTFRVVLPVEGVRSGRG